MQAKGALRLFNLALRRSTSSRGLYSRASWAYVAAKIATHEHLGLFRSAALETSLAAISARLFKGLEPDIQPEKGSVLHVISEAYLSGGHTRAVENWIASEDTRRRSSVVFTRGSFCPESLRNSVLNSGGSIHISKGNTLVRAKLLRKWAYRFELIVLHTHMDDIVPSLAFGDAQLRNRIIRFNHADHRFWVGADLAHLTLETRQWGKKLSAAQRQLTDTLVIGIPGRKAQECECDSSISELLKEFLQIPEGAPVLLTVGTDNKYKALPGQNFALAVRELLAENNNYQFVSVGGKRSRNPDWLKLKQDFSDRVKIIDQVAPEELPCYYHLAHVGLDSFPMSGGSVVQEMSNHGLPIVPLECATGHLDCTYALDTYSRDVKSWKLNVVEILNGNLEWASASARYRSCQTQTLDAKASPTTFASHAMKGNHPFRESLKPEVQLENLTRYLELSFSPRERMLKFLLEIVGRCLPRHNDDYVPPSSEEFR